MIRKQSENRIVEAEGLRGGEGKVRLAHFMEADESFGTGKMFATVTVPPGSSIGYHTHQGDFEIYLIRSGEAVVVDNDRELTLYPGDCMVCRDGESHGLANRGSEDLEFTAIVINSR